MVGRHKTVERSGIGPNDAGGVVLDLHRSLRKPPVETRTGASMPLMGGMSRRQFVSMLAKDPELVLRELSAREFGELSDDDVEMLKDVLTQFAKAAPSKRHSRMASRVALELGVTRYLEALGDTGLAWA